MKSSDTGELKIELDGVTSSTLVIDDSAGTNFTDDTTGIANALNTQGTGAVYNSGASVGGFDVFDIGGYTLYIDQTATVSVV